MSLPVKPLQLQHERVSGHALTVCFDPSDFSPSPSFVVPTGASSSGRASRRSRLRAVPQHPTETSELRGVSTARAIVRFVDDRAGSLRALVVRTPDRGGALLAVIDALHSADVHVSGAHLTDLRGWVVARIDVCVDGPSRARVQAAVLEALNH